MQHTNFVVVETWTSDSRKEHYLFDMIFISCSPCESLLSMRQIYLQLFLSNKNPLFIYMDLVVEAIVISKQSWVEVNARGRMFLIDFWREGVTGRY